MNRNADVATTDQPKPSPYFPSPPPVETHLHFYLGVLRLGFRFLYRPRSREPTRKTMGARRRSCLGAKRLRRRHVVRKKKTTTITHCRHDHHCYDHRCYDHHCYDHHGYDHHCYHHYYNDHHHSPTTHNHFFPSPSLPPTQSITGHPRNASIFGSPNAKAPPTRTVKNVPCWNPNTSNGCNC